MIYMIHPLAHEIAHSLGLRHVYLWGAQENSNTASIDFLDDVFSCYQQTAPGETHCWGAVAPCSQQPAPPGGITFCGLQGVNGCDAYASTFDDCTKTSCMRGGRRGR